MSDPNLALTSYGTGNGTADGTTATSAGNVFVTPYTGASNQHWIVESGDVVISNTVPNIAAISDGTIYSMPNNGYITYFLCPVTEFSHTIEMMGTQYSLQDIVTKTGNVGL